MIRELGVDLKFTLDTHVRAAHRDQCVAHEARARESVVNLRGDLLEWQSLGRPLGEDP